MTLLSYIQQDFLRISNSQPTKLRLLMNYFVNPGFRAAVLHRIAHHLNSRGKLKLAAWIRTRSVSSTGCDIGPAAAIGSALLLHHPVGIVIGSGARVGANCTIFQSVTIGERGFPMTDHRYPNIGDGVTICAGAVVLGAVSVGSGALVGANSVVTHDVPSGSIVAGIPARLLHPPIGDAKPPILE